MKLKKDFFSTQVVFNWIFGGFSCSEYWDCVGEKLEGIGRELREENLSGVWYEEKESSDLVLKKKDAKRWC